MNSWFVSNRWRDVPLYFCFKLIPKRLQWFTIYKLNFMEVIHHYLYRASAWLRWWDDFLAIKYSARSNITVTVFGYNRIRMEERCCLSYHIVIDFQLTKQATSVLITFGLTVIALNKLNPELNTKNNNINERATDFMKLILHHEYVAVAIV